MNRSVSDCDHARHPAVHRADVVAWHGEKERIGKQKIGVGDLAQEIVTNTEAEIEAVELIFREHGEVMWPHVTIVKPGFVFDLAGEKALDAADIAETLPRDRLR